MSTSQMRRPPGRSMMTAADLRRPEERHQSCSIAVIGGTGLIGSRLVAGSLPTVTTSSSRRARRASTRTPARVSPRPSTGRRRSSTSRTPATSTSAGANEFFYGSTLNLLHVRRRGRACATTSRCRSSAPTGWRAPSTATSRPRPRRSGSSASPAGRTRSCTRPSSSSSSRASRMPSTTGNTVRLSHALIQPMAADDVVAAVATIAVGCAGQRRDRVRRPRAVPARRARAARARASAGDLARGRRATRWRDTSAPTSTSASCCPAPTRPSRRRGSTTGSRPAGSPSTPSAGSIPATRQDRRSLPGSPRAALDPRARTRARVPRSASIPPRHRRGSTGSGRR